MKKTFVFKKIEAQPRTRDATEYLFDYSLVDSSLVGKPEEDSQTLHFSVTVGATGTLVSCWGLSGEDLINVLFEYGRRHVAQKFEDGALSGHEELLLSTSSVEIPYPYDPSRIPNPIGSKFEVEFGKSAIMENQNYLQLASSIIDSRDNINAIFSSTHKEKLLLVNEERDLLQFFRDVSTQEEFFFRICALSNAATALNLNVLRRITGITDTHVKSISLLESYLEQFNSSSQQTIKILKTLRSINRIRQGYPVHGDRAYGVLEAHKYFNIDYPVVDYSNSWKTLLTNYLKALKLLLEIVKEKA